MSVSCGEVLVLQGKNGAGKTTLLRVLAGLEDADRMQLAFEGRPIPLRSVRVALRRHVVYVHQRPYLFDRSVAENVAYGLRKRGRRGMRLKADVEEALDWAGLVHLGHRNARRLSGGEQQRVALTRARVLKPKLLLLDEPLGHMDQEAREKSYFLIRRLTADGMAIIIASHEGRNVAKLGDRQLTLDDGRLRSSGEGRQAVSGSAAASIASIHGGHTSD
jgi:tungstate transport system ATP-binding protein